MIQRVAKIFLPSILTDSVGYFSVGASTHSYIEEGTHDMMRLSTRSTYGMRAMFDLALAYGQGPVSVTTIAQREHLTVPYLEQLLNRLRRHGLVDSVRGPKGGYLLSRAPQLVTIGEVVRALEGAPALVTTDGAGRRHQEAPPSHQVTQWLWQQLGAKIAEAFEATTLKDLCDEARELEPAGKIDHPYTFHI